ncbi:MAG: hypothetical protein PHV28_09740 [Kiritimatiellae bacterium]|nr:hypothetical protein [Kiritimatiellia bacterium]
MKKVLYAAVVTFFLVLLFLLSRRPEKQAEFNIGIPKNKSSEQSSSIIRNQNAAETADKKRKQEGIPSYVYKASRLNIGSGGVTVLEIDHGLPKQLVDTPEMRRGVDYGLFGAITLYVVDSTGAPVPRATVRGAFFNQWLPKDKRRFEIETDADGTVSLENNNTGFVNFTVEKKAYYVSVFRYWFLKNGYDCAKDGRWLPWNPTVDVVLKEKRTPIPLYTKTVEKTFPKEGAVGFDCLEKDFVAPFGMGKTADFTFKYESVRPPVRAGMKYPDFSCFTNSLVLSGMEGGGFITKQKDSFSQFVADYEAPKDGYMPVLDYEMKRTTDKIFVDRKLGEGGYLFFRSRVRRTVGGSEEAHYGKIYRFVFGESLRETNSATLKISYYFNPTPNDRNLEFDGTNNLFKPDWKDTNWPKEP